MRILITGVTGFIGRKLYVELKKYHEVLGISRSKSDLLNVKSIDFLNEEELTDYFHNKQFDVIIHLASILANATNNRDISLLIKNLLITNNLIKAIQAQKNCLLINFSSSAVYPNINGEFSEDSPTNPYQNGDCLYGLAKLNSENLFNFLLPTTFKIINLRVGYVYGEGMNENRIHKVFEKELNENNVITVFGNGNRVIPQIYISSLVNIILTFINRPVPGTYNIAEENISLGEIASRIIEKSGNSSSKIKLIGKGNQSNFRLNVEKLNNFLND